MIEKARPADLILCFGEALWDILPESEQPGGAPLNVAFHLRQLGRTVAPVTTLGRDRRGDELLERMRGWGLDLRFTTRRSDRPTGIAEARLDKTGNAVFDLPAGAAWDEIKLTEAQLDLAQDAAALVFGSLALREGKNWETLNELWRHAAGAFRVYDVNLRPPYTPFANVRKLAKQAHLIKLNLAELDQFTVAKDAGSLEERVRRFSGHTGCEFVCVTVGDQGAGLIWQDRWYWSESRMIKVKDTVGAGDAFLAALVDGILRAGADLPAVLDRACRLGEFVASREGATPTHGCVADEW